MALQLATIDTNTQASAAYHQVTRINADFLDGKTQITICTYVSQAAAAAGASPIRRQNINVNAVPNNLLTYCNNQLAAQPQFSGATVVPEAATAG